MDEAVVQERLEKLNAFLQVLISNSVSHHVAVPQSHTACRRSAHRRVPVRMGHAGLRSSGTLLAQLVVEDAEYSCARSTKGFLKISLGDNW